MEHRLYFDGVVVGCHDDPKGSSGGLAASCDRRLHAQSFLHCHGRHRRCNHFVTFAKLFYGFSVYTPRWGNLSLVSYMCVLTGSDYHNVSATLLPWLDTFIASLGPFALLLVANFVLVKALISSVKRARHRLAVGQSTHVTARKKKACSLSVRLIASTLTDHSLCPTDLRSSVKVQRSTKHIKSTA